MFTGIVEATGTVEEVRHGGAVRRIVVATALDVETLPVGASIAVNGVCLTVTSREKGRFSADLGPETLALTTFGSLQPDTRVHLERPLKLGDPLGGHLVSGHVDGVGEVVARRERETSLDLEIAAPDQVARTLVPKGSITVDGVSLTINAVDKNVFTVTLIPHTLAVTALAEKWIGSRVNLEADLIAKHIERLVSASLEAATSGDGGTIAAPPPPVAGGLTLETLRKHGFAR
jgi:riboflavin synthase